MELFITAIYIFLGGFCLLYAIIIGWFSYGWFSMSEFSSPPKKPKTKVSVIVPARNEEMNIGNCLQDIINQNYPESLFEIIIINDNSSDKTKKIVREIISENPGRVVSLINLKNPEISLKGKKQAIKYAVSVSKGDLIVTTDADCRMGEKWLSTIVAYFESRQVKMIIGPVCFHKDNTLFKKLQNLEFLSLIASGAGAAKISHPIMCNGANLAFSKIAYNEVQKNKTDENFSSGDDIFLMLKLKRKYKGSAIHFLKNKEAIIYTEAQNSFIKFAEQRIRWVSKSRAYTSFSLIGTSLVIYIFNYLLLTGFILGFFFQELFSFTLVLFLIKSIIDFPILAGITKFVNRKKLLLFFLPLQLIYILYISVFGFIGNFLKFDWKGRNGK